VKLQWTDWAMIAALAAAGCVAIYAGVTRAMRRAVQERQREMERQLSAMATTVKALQARVAKLGRLQAAKGRERAAISSAEENEAAKKKEPVKPEIVAALTAAATAFLGKKARIRSAQLLPAAQGNPGAWAQEGRVLVQTSHNLRSRE
jgi:C4-dicarboxylate-specific signal transduction histidine kinase